MSDLEVKSKPSWLSIPVLWEKTTAPEPPVNVPSLVELRVASQAVEIHVSDEDIDVTFQKDEIVGVEVTLRPDLPDSAQLLYVRGDTYSRAVIRIRDPFDVLPFFEHTFSSEKEYWLKALVKGLKAKLGIQPTVTS